MVRRRGCPPGAAAVLHRDQGRACHRGYVVRQDVAHLVKDKATRAGLNQERDSGHLLRAGLATAAGDAGAALPDLMGQTRRKSTQVALAYLRPADLWRNHVNERVFATKKDGMN